MSDSDPVAAPDRMVLIGTQGWVATMRPGLAVLDTRKPFIIVSDGASISLLHPDALDLKLRFVLIDYDDDDENGLDEVPQGGDFEPVPAWVTAGEIEKPAAEIAAFAAQYLEAHDAKLRP